MSEAAAPGAFGPRARMARLHSDERLARRAASGDERAFAAIFDRYHQRLYRYCLGIVGNPQDAQDALQNAMVKVLRALPGEERRIDLKPWLYRIAHNESIELLRRRRETRSLDAEQPAPGPGLAGEVASRERLRRLFSDLDQLPERQRGALVMRELAGLDFEQIGTALGTSSAVARQTLYEARQSLRQMDEGREMSCDAVTRALSDGDGRVARRRDLRAHLRTCPSCRRFSEEIEGRSRDLTALSPLPAVAAAGLLQGLLGGHGAAGGSMAAALGGAAAKTVGASTVVKGAATVAVVAAIGVGAADRGGLIDTGLPGGGGSPAIEAEPPVGADPAGGASGADSASSTTGVGESAAGTGDGGLGGSRAVQGGGGPASSADGKTNAAADTASAPTSQGSSASHPSGRGHAKQLPSSAAHGQQTAAAHKAPGQGPGGNEGKPAKPSHPVKSPPPSKPASPGAEKGSSAPPHSAAGGAPASEGASPPAVEAAPAPSAEPETGKKP